MTEVKMNEGFHAMTQRVTPAFFFAPSKLFKPVKSRSEITLFGVNVSHL